MKRFLLLFGIFLLAMLSIFAWNNWEQTAITGRVNPVDGANSAWAIGGRDSATSNIVNGNFSFSLKPGIYKVVVDGIEPYKDAVLENISVKEGQTVDVGEIMLQRTLIKKR
ncbi:MAG: carboxypeptidase regulatory-like domain-containing protein [Bacteroidetes bacterium]|nr:MAG: carboxypeptidase regulatory-like domain-containing protein [Bacteroidota bacterium]